MTLRPVSASSKLDFGVAELAESFVDTPIVESLGDFRYEGIPNSKLNKCLVTDRPSRPAAAQPSLRLQRR